MNKNVKVVTMYEVWTLWTKSLVTNSCSSGPITRLLVTQRPQKTQILRTWLEFQTGYWHFVIRLNETISHSTSPSLNVNLSFSFTERLLSAIINNTASTLKSSCNGARQGCHLKKHYFAKFEPSKLIENLLISTGPITTTRK